MGKSIGNKIIEKSLTVFAWLVLLVALLTSIFVACAMMSGEENGKEIFGYKILIVNTDSMKKSADSENESIFFEAGDVIVIRKVDNPNELKAGDVITFCSYNPGSMGKTLSHKIREIRYLDSGEISGYVTYGINTGTNDMVVVKPEHVVGKYVFKVESIGKLFAELKTERGFYLSILVPGVLLIIYFSIKVGKVLGKQEFEKMNNKEKQKISEKEKQK